MWAFLWSSATGMGRVLLFQLLRGKFLEIWGFFPLSQTCWHIFPEVSLSSVRYLPSCSIFWNLHSTFDLIHTASCHSTQLLPAWRWTVCLPCSSLLSHPGPSHRFFFSARLSFLLILCKLGPVFTITCFSNSCISFPANDEKHRCTWLLSSEAHLLFFNWKFAYLTTEYEVSFI